MRLAYLVSKYPSENHTYILREVSRLRAHGIDVEVVTITPDDRRSDEVSAADRAEQAATFAVKSRGALGILADNLWTLVRRPRRYVRGALLARRLAGADLKRIAYNLAYLAQAAVVGRWLLRRGHGRLHVHYASTVGLLAAAMFDVDVSATIHGSAEFINPDLQQLREKVRAFKFTVAISRFGRSQLMLNSDPADWPKIHVVPLGVDRDMGISPGPAPSPNLGGRKLNSPGRPFHVACVGQLQPAKGLHVLLDAAALLRAQGRNLRVTLVGDGPYAASLAERARSTGVDVVFTGRLNQDRVRAVYADSDAFVLASFAEGVPVVLMEAMACGVPCVATRIAGIPELIRDGVDGLLVTPSDVEELARAVATLMDDDQISRRLANSARARVGELYALDTNVDQLTKVFGFHYGGEAPSLGRPA